MSKNLPYNSSSTKPEERFYEEDEENFIENNDDYEKETNNINDNNDNNIDNTNKKGVNGNTNNNNSNNNETHNEIRERLLKMEAETKKITQMQNKYDMLNNNNNNDIIDNENDEIIEIRSNSSNNNNYIESNEETQLPSPTHKSKTSNASSPAANPNILKTNEMPDENDNMVEYPSIEDQKMLDERSIFINNLHTDTTAAELQQLFATCGTIERITIVCDKWSGKPKGCSYIQFKSKESIDNAMILHGREVKGKIISVEQKRTNLPKWLRGRGGRARGRGMIGRGRAGRAYFMPPYYGPPMMPMPPYGYYRGRGYRSRGFWQPY